MPRTLKEASHGGDDHLCQAEFELRQLGLMERDAEIWNLLTAIYMAFSPHDFLPRDEATKRQLKKLQAATLLGFTAARSVLKTELTGKLNELKSMSLALRDLRRPRGRPVSIDQVLALGLSDSGMRVSDIARMLFPAEQDTASGHARTVNKASRLIARGKKARELAAQPSNWMEERLRCLRDLPKLLDSVDQIGSGLREFVPPMGSPALSLLPYVWAIRKSYRDRAER